MARAERSQAHRQTEGKQYEQRKKNKRLPGLYGNCAAGRDPFAHGVAALTTAR